MNDFFNGLEVVIQYRVKDKGGVWINMAAFDSFAAGENYLHDLKRNTSDFWEYQFVEVKQNVSN